ncbi:hypothetical protein V8B97DRAFT_2023439 [Scleroderma yunnanense]
MLLLTESTIYWLNLTSNNKANKLVNHVKNWVNIIVTAGNGTLSNSVALDLQSEQTPNPPSSTIPSLTTKATSVSSSVSNIDAVYKKTHRELVVSTTITHANPESDDKFDQSIFKVAYTTSLPQAVSTTIPHANPESDDEFGQSIVEAAQTSLKHKHTSHNSTEYITSEVEEMDDDGSDISIYDRNAKPESGVTTLVCLLVHLSPMLTYVELQTKISINKPVKKAKTSNDLQHGATDTLAEDLGQSVLAGTMPYQMSSIGTNSRHVHYVNNDLPAELQEDRQWMKHIIPTFLVWVGSLSNLWVIPDQELMCVLQIVVTTICPNFQDLTAIHPRVPIFVLAVQQLTLWCSNFGSTAIALVAHFLVLSSNNAETDEPSTTQTICNELLEDFAFLYQDLDAMTPANAFQSHFILHLLASVHLWSCIGCSNISRLSTDMLTEQGIKEAIALCCSVLKCAIHLFESSDLQVDDQNSTCGKPTLKTPLKLNKISRKESSNSFAFSEQHWGPCTWQYVTLITKHDDAVLKDIVAMANALIMPSMMEMSEDSSFQGDQMAEDIAKAAAQCINLCRIMSQFMNSMLTTMQVNCETK